MQGLLWTVYLRNGVSCLHHICSPFPDNLRKNSNILKNHTPIKLFVKDFKILRMIPKFNKTKSFQLNSHLYW